MDEQKMHLIKKIFQNKPIRTVWNSEEEKYYVSIVDIVKVITQSKNSQAYWRKLKQRLKEEGNETVTNCHSLKMKAADGKYRLTDVCDVEGMFRIIESIPSKNAEPIKQWLAYLGKERIDEIYDPSIAMQRSIDLYRSKGYDESWIDKRMKSLQERKSLTDVWQENGITDKNQFAILTDEIYKTWSDMTAREYKKFKGLKKESLRDNMDSIELLLSDLSEEATKRIAIKKRPLGFKQNIGVAHMGGNVAKVARQELEQNLGETIITTDNKLGCQNDNKKELSNNI